MWTLDPICTGCIYADPEPVLCGPEPVLNPYVPPRCMGFEPFVVLRVDPEANMCGRWHDTYQQLPRFGTNGIPFTLNPFGAAGGSSARGSLSRRAPRSGGRRRPLCTPPRLPLKADLGIPPLALTLYISRFLFMLHIFYGYIHLYTP